MRMTPSFELGIDTYKDGKTDSTDAKRQNFEGICNQHWGIRDIVEEEKQEDERNSS